MRTVLAVSLLSMFTACADDAGTPPTISSLMYSPNTVARGQQSTITGTLLFSDDDGDLAQLAVEVTLPDATKQTLPATDIRGVGDTKEGTLGFQMILVPPASGTYRFTLFLTDDGDNESNRLDGMLTAP